MAFALLIPRIFLLGLCIVLSIVVLGLAANLTNLSSHAHAITNYEVMALITSILSILILPALIIIPHVLFLWTDLVIICVLWVLWVVTAALTIQARDALFGDSDCSIFVSQAGSVCNQITALEGISVTIFVLLLLYMLALFIYGVVGHTRHSDKGIWSRRMHEHNNTPLTTQRV